MRRVSFLIPGSLTRTFVLQIAAFNVALQRLQWRQWEPHVHACLAGETTPELLRDCDACLSGVQVTFLPASPSSAPDFHARQIDELFRTPSAGADVLVRSDADTLPVGDFEDLLDYVVRTDSLAGVLAHYPFPAPEGMTAREAWLRVSDGLIRCALTFDHAYSLVAPEADAKNRQAPFYVNDGAVFIPATLFDALAARYLALRPRVQERLVSPYFAGQVALALAAADLGAPTRALPMRFNFPNDELAARRFPEELADVRIFHYLRTDSFDRHEIFGSESGYRRFMEARLDGVQRTFRDAARRVFGDRYPFAALGVEVRRPRDACPCPHAGTAVRARETPESVRDRIPLDALAVAKPAWPHLQQFADSGNRSLEALMNGKRALCAALGTDLAFAACQDTGLVARSDRLIARPLGSLQSFAKRQAEVFVETASRNVPFVILAPRVLGDAAARDHRHVSRTGYVACLRDAIVRGRSATIGAGGCVLLDYEDREFDLFDCELDIDPAIFHASGKRLLTLDPDTSDIMQVDEAFTLLGPQSDAFGDWMTRSLPQLVAADMSGALPPVPILIDSDMPQSIRRSLALVVCSGTELIEVPPYAAVMVRKLWCGPSLGYAPAREVMNDRFRFDYLDPDPTRFVAVVREIRRRVDVAVPLAPGPKRVFLARRDARWRRLVNAHDMETLARARGFHVVSPAEMTFDEQVAAVRDASHIMGPEGSTLFLAYFATPGTKLCVLNHTLVDAAVGFAGVFDGIDLTILTGPITTLDERFPHRSDYLIDEQTLGRFLDDWLDG